MASTSSITYCTDRDLQDVFPGISGFDLKRRIYGWTTETLDGNTYYVAYNSGLITQLFIDGKSQQSGNQTIGTTAATAINSVAGYARTATTIVVDDGDELEDSTYIRIGNEILGITNIATNTLTVVRAQLGTSTNKIISNDTPIYLHFQPESVGDNLHDADNDFIILKAASDPNDLLVEAGDDWETIKTRFRKQASRLLESRIDANLSREVSKDREGNYPDIIVRATSLQAVILLLTAHDTGNESLEAFKSEYSEILEGLNAGIIVLPSDRTSDSKNGVIRDVTVNAGSTVRPVELRGQYIGSGYDLLKVKITTAGAIGVAKYSVWNKNTSGLKNNKVIDSEFITGDYNLIGGGLYLRWSGTDDDSVTYINDEYEIEVFSSSLGTSTPSGIKTVSMSRR